MLTSWLRAFNPEFRRLLFVTVASNLADGLTLVAFPLLAMSLTNSAAEVAWVSTARTIPWLLLSLPSGLLIDRLNRRDIVMIADIVRVLVLGAAGTAAIFGMLGMTSLMLAAFIAGATEVFADNTTMTMVRRLVPPEDRDQANGRIMSAEVLMNRFIGVPIAGFIATNTGPAVVLELAAAAYVIALGALLGISRTQLAIDTTDTAKKPESLLASFAYVWRDRTLRAFMITMATLNSAFAGVEALLVVYTTRDMHTPEWLFGLLLSLMGAGTILGARAAPRVLASFGRYKTYLLAVSFAAIVFFVIALAPYSAALALSFLVLGSMTSIANLVITGYMQKTVADTNLGKVGGIFRFIGIGTLSLAAMLAGTLATQLSIAATYLVFACGSLVILGSCLRLVRPQDLDQETVPSLSEIEVTTS